MKKSYTLQDGAGRTLVRNIEWLIPFKEGGCEDIINKIYKIYIYYLL